MKRTTTILIVAGASAIAVAAGTGIVVATAGDDDDHETESPITGRDLERATRAALAHTGGGRVTDTEVGDEDSRYEVEVTLDSGRQIDVQLDEQFDVVGDEADDDTIDD